ncbi:hypothetical protein BDY19DRAFT_406875 [Irpex rosettiformis]|uniref:Uncharacterized protein n=1 Tax=Irpex rosettiformis TaxID=378272 RepID=A0ACB8UF88_9APHY|nr:hypothetical protein BDY19DRAFT_406875 [Irpex rosettiformis]
MSLPKTIIQITIAGAQIFGKAFVAAGRQAIQNAKSRPEAAMGGDVSGLQTATSGSLTDRLTREHRMTLDEARLILNLKKEDPAEKIIQHYDHLFKVNSPPAAPPKPPTAGKKVPLAVYSHYLQSKIVRARERIDAEIAGETASKSQPQPTETTPPPPPEQPKPNP